MFGLQMGNCWQKKRGCAQKLSAASLAEVGLPLVGVGRPLGAPAAGGGARYGSLPGGVAVPVVLLVGPDVFFIFHHVAFRVVGSHVDTAGLERSLGGDGEYSCGRNDILLLHKTRWFFLI